MGGRWEGPGGAKTGTEAHGKDGMISAQTMVSIDTVFGSEKLARRVPRALAMADAPEHPLTGFVNVDHG